MCKAAAHDIDTECNKQKSLIKERTTLFGHVLGKRYGTALQS